MPRFQMQMEVEHAILFLSDAIDDFAIPDNTGSAFVVATADCLAFCVMPDVDGASLVTVTDHDCDSGTKLWSGTLSVTSGVVTLSDSAAFHYIYLPTPAREVEVDIWADDERYPEWVWIKLSAIGHPYVSEEH